MQTKGLRVFSSSWISKHLEFSIELQNAIIFPLNALENKATDVIYKNQTHEVYIYCFSCNYNLKASIMEERGRRSHSQIMSLSNIKCIKNKPLPCQESFFALEFRFPFITALSSFNPLKLPPPRVLNFWHGLSFTELAEGGVGSPDSQGYRWVVPTPWSGLIDELKDHQIRTLLVGLWLSLWALSTGHSSSISGWW